MSIFSSPKNEIFRSNKVFVPGGLPKLTYNPRQSLGLETQLGKANDNLCKLVMVTGSTKSGKTVLTSTVFDKASSVWYDGGAFSTEEEFWRDICNYLNVDINVSNTEQESDTANTGAAGTVEKNFLVLKASVNLNTSRTAATATSKTITSISNPKTLAINTLKQSETPLIIDDFHYIPREFQGNIVRALKSAIFEGAPVIFLAIPHRRLDAIKVEKEMTGRVENISVPAWQREELIQIAEVGFPLLNLKVHYKIIDQFADEALGSPHLMQEFCRELCNVHKIVETAPREVSINDESLDELFEKVALHTGKVMFDKLGRGPRQRSDRMERHLKQGGTTDIYGLVLQGLAELKPGMEKVDYETLRTKIRDLSQDNPPQAHEISRVLEHMSNIAANDESSTPVIDWDKEERILHITDPFFAYYLRWGVPKHGIDDFSNEDNEPTQLNLF